ncbi:WPP domain-associated protein-like [Magnolia sinica]|uniref:WPP domain-associated protein-like n=1 Tax=Magnolia sinica TaxID=86752 RepID=UPI00265B614D|nr:WPP domain-associated protein-like [Magnolia sinica]
MENSEVTDVGVSSSSDWSMQPSGSFKSSENFGSDSAFYEKFLLEDLDSYMEDINVRLTISRMVSDSIIKGMVTAVSEEAAEKIASKEAEVAFLNERLQFYESDADKDKELGLSTVANEAKQLKFEVPSNCLDSRDAKPYPIKEHLGYLKKESEEQFHRLAKEIGEMKGCSSISRMNSGGKHEGNISDKWVEIDRSLSTLKNILRSVYEQIDNVVFFPKASLDERQWELDFQEEIEGIVFQSYIRSLLEDFKEKPCEQRNHLPGSQNKKWMMKVDELTSLREELDIISRSLSVPESGKLLSHGSHEIIDEWTSNERKDRIHRKVLGAHISPSISVREENGSAVSKKSKEFNNAAPEIAESAQLKHMSKEELISYFNTEITKMKRNHETAVQEITEEYFSFRREFLKEKGSSHPRKDKEFDALRKKIPEVILKLDSILVENEKFPAVCDDHQSICSLNDSLVRENQRLRDMLMDKKKEIKCLHLQVSDAADKMSNHSLAETNFLKRIKKLKCDMEDLKIDAFIQQEIYKTVLRELTKKTKREMDDADIEAIFMHEISAIIFQEAFKDADAAFNLTMMQYNEEKQRVVHLEAILFEKVKTLDSETEEKEKLKQEIVSLMALMEEKEKLSSEVGTALMKQKENFELVCQELSTLRDRASRQEILISENNKELDSIKGILKEALERNQLYEVQVGELNQKLKVAVDKWRESERQKSILNAVIQEKQSTVLSAIENEQAQRKQMESVVVSVQELSKFMFNFECRVAENVVRNSARLEMLNNQCSPLVQLANLLKRKELVYKLALERRCSDLQKAEAEVDLLGDEVDALLSLLEKIYIALDHYSPIFQNYTGVMEIMELVRRELKGERHKPI